MFTGLVEAMGELRASDADGAGGRLLHFTMPFAAELKLGESVAVNGCCLTVVECDADAAAFEAGPETLAKTDLGRLRVGEKVNLERAMRLNDRIGGHLVTGHIDGLGKLAIRQQQGEWQTAWFNAPVDILRQMVPKGSIAVNGVSLTVVEVRNDRFSVMLIPHTLSETTLGRMAIGAAVNLETDLIGKYVAQWMTARS
jgi:riboflavin synthase